MTTSPRASSASAASSSAASSSAGAPPVRRPGAIRDTGHVFLRELLPILRDPFSVVVSLLQPLVFLIFFAPLLSGMSGLPLSESLQWFVPGIIVMSTLFGTAMAGSNLLFELQSGSHERMLVAPVARSALMAGRALKEMVPLLIGAVVLTLAVPLRRFPRHNSTHRVRSPQPRE